VTDSNDNAGVAGFGVNIGGGWTYVANVSPLAVYNDGLGDGFDTYIGFSLGRTSDGSPGQKIIGGEINPIGADEQFTIGVDNPPLVFGFGQSGGDLDNEAPPGSGGAITATQKIYAANLLFAQGTYSGNVFFASQAGLAPPAVFLSTVPTGDVASAILVLKTQTLSIPEPSSLAILSGWGIICLRRRSSPLSAVRSPLN
jgi:hypothetical protein